SAITLPRRKIPAAQRRLSSARGRRADYAKSSSATSSPSPLLPAPVDPAPKARPPAITVAPAACCAPVVAMSATSSSRRSSPPPSVADLQAVRLHLGHGAGGCDAARQLATPRSKNRLALNLGRL